MTSLVDFYNSAYAENSAFEKAMINLSSLYLVDHQEFTERFKKWVEEQPISWRNGVEILKIRFAAEEPLPWSKQVGPSEHK